MKRERPDFKALRVHPVLAVFLDHVVHLATRETLDRRLLMVKWDPSVQLGQLDLLELLAPQDHPARRV